MLSAIVLAHNQLELTSNCLAALGTALHGVEGEVICVDNASAPVLPETIGQQLGGIYTHVRNDENLTFSVANNRAAAASRGDVLVFVNNDVVVSADSLAALQRAFDADPAVGVIGARLEFPDARGLQHAGIVQMLWGLASNFGSGSRPDDPRWRVATDRFAVTGALLAMRRSLFESVGGFDERYRWGYEDVDLCLKAWAAGARVRYEPAVHGLHHESATLAPVRRKTDFDSNYRVYRETWDDMLRPREQAYLDGLRAQGIRRVVIVGTGEAGRALARVMQDAGIETVAFTDTLTTEVREVEGRRCVPLGDVAGETFDRLLVGTQFFFEIEHRISAYDPMGAPLFPAVW
jgi:GT2 family glycosyltransferase